MIRIINKIKLIMKYRSFNLRVCNSRHRNAQRKKARKKFIENNPYCVFCYSIKDLTIDHIIPKSKNGVNAQSNWQVLCSKCNYKKSNKIYRF